MSSAHLTVSELIDRLQKIPDKSKWVWVDNAGFITGVDDCPEYDDPDGEDQSTTISLTVHKKDLAGLLNTIMDCKHDLKINKEKTPPDACGKCSEKHNQHIPC